jgi:glyoxylate carboligase
MENTLFMKKLQTDQENLEAFSEMKHLRNHLDENSYLELVKEAQQKRDIDYLLFMIIKNFSSYWFYAYDHLVQREIHLGL